MHGRAEKKVKNHEHVKRSSPRRQTSRDVKQSQSKDKCRQNMLKYES